MDASSHSCSFQGCGKTFRRKDRLDVHVRTHTGERPFVCHFDGCTSSYARLQHLRRHIERSHTVGYKELIKVKCPHCDIELANTSCLQKHMLSFHDAHAHSKSYKCQEEGCRESFHKKKQLVVHQLQQHSAHLVDVRKCYSCPHDGCGKLFSFPNKLKHHLKIHQGYSCDVKGCSQVLPNWSSLRKHRAVCHSPTLSCTICGAVFQQKSNWKQHIKIHSASQKPHTCPRENCDRIFLYKKNLNQHIREFHDGEVIWKNRLKKQSSRRIKKQRGSRKKSLAAHLCGFDDQADEVNSCMQSLDHRQRNETSQGSTDKPFSDIIMDVAVVTSQCDSISDPDIFMDKTNYIETGNNCIKDGTENLPYAEFSGFIPAYQVSESMEYHTLL